MPLSRLCLAVSAAALLALPVAAQDQEQVTELEELIAMPLKTPPWWEVSDADTVVHVMALPAWTPEGMDWDDTLIEQKVTGAHSVILPGDPQVRIDNVAMPARLGFNVWALPVIAVKGYGQVKALDTNPPQAPAELLARVRVLNPKHDADDDKLNPTAAGVKLWTILHERAGLARGEVEDEVHAMADEHGAKVVRIPVFKIGNIDWMIAKTRPVDLACLTAAVEEGELGPDEVRYAALAWARGRMEPLRKLKSSEIPCAVAITGRSDFARGTISDEVSAIRAALRQKGHAVALIPADHLLGDAGVLKRLESRNVKVEALQGAV